MSATVDPQVVEVVRARTAAELFDQLDELARCVIRLVEIATDIGWAHGHGFFEEDKDVLFNDLHSFETVLAGSVWEVLHGVGWGGSGCCVDRECMREHAEDLISVVAIARRRHVEEGAS